MNILIPPHIGWPLAIIALLLMSVGASMSALYFANADGGAQIVDGYYEKAANWDAHMQQEADNEKLGWLVDLELTPVAGQTHSYVLDVSAASKTGIPLERLEVSVRASRPQHSRSLAESTLEPVPDQLGVYGSRLVLETAGLWDFEIVLQESTNQFITTLRKEL
jgi:hypothetical protein